MSPRSVIVGPPGSGKTTVGTLLAQAWGVEFRDTDRDIEETAGKSVRDIFLDDGEPEFRRLEHAAVAAAVAEHEGVLALGGGAVLDPQTRKLLLEETVVFLDVGLSDAVSRVGMNRDRPLLLGNPRAQLKRQLELRHPLYMEVATLVVTTDGRTPEDITSEIVTNVP